MSSEMDLRATPLGFQCITNLSAAVGLTLPHGAQQAQATGCSLAGNILTVGGTLTGSFGVGQLVTGTGIPVNTLITAPGFVASTWQLNNVCSTESAETVTAYQFTWPDYARLGAQRRRHTNEDAAAGSPATRLGRARELRQHQVMSSRRLRARLRPGFFFISDSARPLTRGEAHHYMSLRSLDVTETARHETRCQR